MNQKEYNLNDDTIMITLLSVSGLFVERQNVLILDNISFNLNRGEQLLITGEAGSGKTSLALVLAGQLYARGNIKIDFDSNNPYPAKVSLIQQFYEFKNKSGLNEFYYQQRYNSYDSENAATVAQVLFTGNEQINSQIEYLLNELNLSERIDAPLIQLSSGERKKLQLIEQLAFPSQIVILDNPYIGLDIVALRNLNNYLEQLTTLGITIILITDETMIPDFITHVATITPSHKFLLTTKDLFKKSVPDATITLPGIKFDLPVITPNKLKFRQIVEFKKVSIVYGENKVLNEVDWTVQHGDKWLLAGHNGAGKSTLLSLIYGDHPQAYSNEIYLFGKRRGSGETIWEIKENIGFISPELHWNFPTDLTCLDTVLSGFFDTPGLYQKPSAEQIIIAKDWLAKLFLAQYTNQYFANVSAGIQRMVLLVRAIVKNPPLFIFDEPCQGLDEKRTRQFNDLVDDLFVNHNRSMIYVSHNKDQIPKCINQILRLNHGKIIS